MQTPALATIFALLAPTVAAQSPLSFRTSEEPMAQWVLSAFSSHTELPDLQPGQHWELALGNGPQIGVRVLPGETGMFECTARPGELMELFEDSIRPKRAMLQGLVVTGLAGVGVKTKEAVKFYRAVLAFPAQIGEVRLRVDGDFGPSIRQTILGSRWSIELDPVVGTWFDRLVRAIKHHSAGPAALADEDAHLTVQWAARMDDKEVIAPFTEFFASFYSDSGSSREKRIQMTEVLWETLGGTFAIIVDFEHESYITLKGVADVERLQRLYDDPDFKAWIEAEYLNDLTRDPSLEDVQFVPDGFEYRGLEMHKIVFLGEEGESLGVDGVTARWAISCVGMLEAEIKAVVDRVLDGRIQSVPLPEGVLAAIRMRHLSEWDLGGTGQMDGAPGRVDVTVGKTATGLVMRVEIE